MTPKRDLIIIVFCLVALGTSTLTIWRTWRPPGAELKPNILVISTCSLRYKLLEAFGHTGDPVMPGLDKFFAHSSFLFTNAFNGIPWIAMFSYAREMIPAARVAELGYNKLSNTQQNYIFRVPHRESWGHTDVDSIDDSDFEKNHAAETAYLKDFIQNGPRPFYVIAHYKYMHYPLIDRHNPDSGWDDRLSAEERERVSGYVDHPERYPEKFPFLILLSNDNRVVLRHPALKSLAKIHDPLQQIKMKGLITDPGFLQTWKTSPGFNEDLALLEKIYAGNARYLDRILTPILDLWGDEELNRNTVVIFAGDHGELHMEHDVLTHGSALFDEALKVPLAIRFPGESKVTVIDGQMHYRMLASVIQGIMRGLVSSRNLPLVLERVREDAFVLRDCINRHRGLRINNKYKYIFDVATDRATLFDLRRDPAESHDIASERPDLVEKFERQFWELYPRYTQVDPGSCYTWVKGSEG